MTGVLEIDVDRPQTIFHTKLVGCMPHTHRLAPRFARCTGGMLASKFRERPFGFAKTPSDPLLLARDTSAATKIRYSYEIAVSTLSLIVT